MWGVLLLLPGASLAQEQPQWIWSADQRTGSVPEGPCFFRKLFSVDRPISGELKIAADDEYEVFLNGRRIGTGKSTEVLDQYDVSGFLRTGQNLVAVRVANTRGATAALGASLTVRDRAGSALTISSDASWLTHLSPLPLWHTPLYNDSRWTKAQTLGRVGATPPWDSVERQRQIADGPAPARSPTPADDPAPLAAEPVEPRQMPVSVEPALPVAQTPATGPGETGLHNRTPESAPPPAQTPGPAPARREPAPVTRSEPPAERPAPKTAPSNQEDQFVVELVMDGQTTGSLLAVTFNEFGHVLASREQGGVVLIYDANRDGLVDQVRVANDQIKDCRGLLCLNGELFATGQGPEGLALYRLTDEDRDGQFEQIRTVLKFEGQGGQYGPRGIVLGTDGLLYVAIGCLARPAAKADPVSPYRRYYEGDLVQPRYEDPNSDLAGVSAPAGTIIRLTPDGQKLQTIAGGFYDAAGLAIDQLGELFAQDSETAADLGTPWFRHAAVYHVLPGAEFGWRSGSAKWPEHFVDRLPATLETGRGAVTGMTFYNHYAFPEEYRNALFIANWTHGRISALKLEPRGSSYTAASELFVDDPALHVTGMAVGPDGALYFVTGDQGEAGGLYRIRWTGKLPPGASDWGSGLSGVIRQPQLEAAWSRQRIASEKTAMGEEWGRLIEGVAASQANSWSYRARALDLLQLFGPAPATAHLTALTGAEAAQVRVKAAELMGLRDERQTRDALIGLLGDSDLAVCRRACEALVRRGQTPPPNALIEVLKSDDRHAVWSARKLLECIPPDQWSERLLAGDDHRVVLQAGLALLVVQPGPENARRVLDRLTALAGGFTSDRDFLDLLRVLQLALLRGDIAPEDAAESAQLLAEEFPSKDRLINRELMRLLAYLRVSSIMDRYLEYLGSEETLDVEKLHVALHLPLLADDWNVGRQIQLIEFLDAAQGVRGGSARDHCVTKASRDFAQSLSDEQTRAILAEGDRWPHAAVALLYRLPERLDADTRTTLTRLDERLAENHDHPSRRLKVGIVAVLARSGDPESLAFLRSLWDRAPERRPAVAMGLAQWPSGENWNYLVRSLPLVEADVAREILEKLQQAELAPEEPEYYRQVILRGLELDGPGAAAAVALLEHWTGIQQAADGDRQAQLAAWQEWFAATWPDHPQARPSAPRAGRIWQYDALIGQLADDGTGPASAENGAVVFLSAGCASCHRCGEQGGGRAPDLTSVGHRLMRKEIVKSLLYPSDVVAVPYLTKIVITTRGRVLSGRISPLTEPGAVVLVQPDAQRVAVPVADVDETRAIHVSDMPEGLLEPLSAQDIRDLFAFLLAGHEPLLARQTAAPVEPETNENLPQPPESGVEP
jgi:putative heme-binding domain-containing protein